MDLVRDQREPGSSLEWIRLDVECGVWCVSEPRSPVPLSLSRHSTCKSCQYIWSKSMVYTLLSHTLCVCVCVCVCV